MSGGPGSGSAMGGGGMSGIAVGAMGGCVPGGRRTGGGDRRANGGAAAELARAGLAGAARAAEARGIAVPAVRGKLLRPLAALAFVPPERRRELDDRFWHGCLAVQMAHEASLHHDDILDGGTARRSGASLMAREGRAAALLAGDLYLTGSYLVARMTGSPGFEGDHAEAVAATVQGERRQAEGAAAPAACYDEVVRAKSGALFGAAAALGGWLGVAGRSDRRAGAADRLRRAGTELGALYQMVDDFLDYCPLARTGKPGLQDFRNRVWTFVLGDEGDEWFDQSPEAALRWFFARSGGPSMADRALARVREQGAGLVDELRGLGADAELVAAVRGWVERCETAASAAGVVENGRREGPGTGQARQARAALSGAARAGAGASGGTPPAASGPGSAAADPDAAAAAAQVAARAIALGPPDRWGGFFARNSRTFSFASLLFPARERAWVRGVYAFCRFTDDLVDQADGPARRTRALLDAWEAIARSAHGGARTGIPLADRVMGEMAARQVPFALAADLIEGVRMDIEPREYGTMDDLKLYTRRVASVVGVWLTRGFGVHDPWVIARAHELGHAMQLTNIVRDVGEDLEMGRVYLPLDRMAAHGVTRESIASERSRLARAGAAPARVDPGYAALMEELMAAADRSYALAYEAMPELPGFFRRPVAVAAQAYRGIHDELRAGGCNNLTRRAHTSLPRKLVLGRQGLARLRVANGRQGSLRTQS